MHVGVIGGGIVGSAVAATLKQHLLGPTTTTSSSSSCSSITIIDDGRPHRTSVAGHGYLWSVHRSRGDLRRSVDAKNAWLDLIGGDGGDRGGREIDELFERKRGSLLVALRSARRDGDDDVRLREFYERHELRDELGLRWIDDISTMNPFVRPGAVVCGVHCPLDYTCSPPELIGHLSERYDLSTKVERRTVTSLEYEAGRFDVVVCCAGPWVNELWPDAGVVPVRGVLLKASTTSASAESAVPMMEFGYGGDGVHFTLSRRDGRWLVGSSRESHVGFDPRRDLHVVEERLLRRAEDYVLPGVIGPVVERVVGFRPALTSPSPGTDDDAADDGRCYRIRKVGSNVVLVAGFEGQGVLYAALAAREVADLVLSML